MSYHAVVNKKDINMGRLTSALNDMESKGWRLAHIFAQDGNTIEIFQSGGDVLEQLLAEQRRTNQLLEWLGQRLGASAAGQ